MTRKGRKVWAFSLLAACMIVSMLGASSAMAADNKENKKKKQEHSAPFYNIRDYGAVGDGISDDTAAIQSAINEASVQGGTVYIPGGNYLVKGNGDQLLLLKKPIRVLGDGFFSRLVVSADVPNTTDVIRISPELGIGWQFTIDSINIIPQGNSKPARHALNIDISTYPQFMSKLLLQNNYFWQLGGHSVMLTNPKGDPSLFTSSFQDNVFYGGLSLLNAGDSINITGNTITGENTGIDLSQVPGAAKVVIAFNNITAAGGAVRVTDGNQVKILYNQIEQNQPSTNPQSAVITLDGQTNPVVFSQIVGNNINAWGWAGHADHNILLGNAAYTKISGNTLYTGNKAMIELKPQAIFTEIGYDNFFGSNTGTILRSAAINDNGVGTTGVQKQAVLQNGWVNFDDQTFSGAAFSKDSEGKVTLNGLIKDGTMTMGTVLFELPAGFRPAKAMKFSINTVQDGVQVPGEIQITSTGQVLFMRGGNTYLSLSGVSFTVEG